MHRQLQAPSGAAQELQAVASDTRVAACSLVLGAVGA
jgi:hypothetical protein